MEVVGGKFSNLDEGVSFDYTPKGGGPRRMSVSRSTVAIEAEHPSFSATMSSHGTKTSSPKRSSQSVKARRSIRRIGRRFVERSTRTPSLLA